MVVQQPQEIERLPHSSNDADTNHLCGRQQYELGLQPEPTSPPWLLVDSIGSGTIHRLEGAQSGFSGAPDVSPPQALHNSDSNGQHYQHVLQYINKQGGTRSLALLNLAIEVWNWCLQHKIAIQAQHIISGVNNTIADMESVFHRRSNLWGPFSVDLFANRTTKLLPNYVSWLPDSRAIHTDAFTIPWTMFRDSFINPPWNLMTSVLHKVLLEQLPRITVLVPYWPSAMWFPPLQRLALTDPLLLPPQTVQTTSPVTPHPLQQQNWMLSVWWLLSGKNWNHNDQAIDDLLQQRLAPTATNKGYRKSQLRFLEWAQRHRVFFTAFTGADMVNFLADMRQTHRLQATTLKTLRSAVAHLHNNLLSTLSKDTLLVNSYLDSLVKQAPPVSIHRPTVDLTPALVYARTIPSCTTTSIKQLQQKLAFLLSMAAFFLRPSFRSGSNFFCFVYGFF